MLVVKKITNFVADVINVVIFFFYWPRDAPGCVSVFYVLFWCVGVCFVHSSVWLSGDPAYPGALYPRADPTHPGRTPPALWATGTGMTSPTCHPKKKLWCVPLLLQLGSYCMASLHVSKNNRSRKWQNWSH